MILEICTNSFESALAAQNAGAQRIELCNELSLGGITPSYGLLEKVLSELTIPVYVLIRPRSGNFTYSNAELDVMLKDIEQFKKMGAQGIVSGVLTANNNIDLKSTKLLLEASKGIDFTFHRAFDWCNKPKQAIIKLEQIGIGRILTSGQKRNAFEGLPLLKELKSLSNTIKIMPGGCITKDNALVFKKAGFDEIHCSASEKIQTLKTPPKVSMESNTAEGIITRSSEEKIREILNKLS